MIATAFEDSRHSERDWVRKARGARIAADGIDEEELAEGTIAYGDRQALIYSVAIDNACRARRLRIGKPLEGEGILTLEDGSNKLRAIVQQSGYSPSSKHLEFLSQLDAHRKVLANPPFASDPGSKYLPTPKASTLVEEIIVAVLQDDDLVEMFLGDAEA